MTFKDNKVNERPVFPKRAVITGGMPYGNKELHFGQIAGVFIHADMFARFLRENRQGKFLYLYLEQIAMVHLQWKGLEKHRKKES